jgi:hypothetical protein
MAAVQTRVVISVKTDLSHIIDSFDYLALLMAYANYKDNTWGSPKSKLLTVLLQKIFKSLKKP